jgi:hypothetical protein
MQDLIKRFCEGTEKATLGKSTNGEKSIANCQRNVKASGKVAPPPEYYVIKAYRGVEVNLALAVRGGE